MKVREMSKIDALLKNEKVEWKRLGEVCEILDFKRKPIKKSKRVFGEYPYYGANGIQDYVNDFIFDGTFILTGEDGSVINQDNTPILHWIQESKIWVNNHAHVLGKLDSKYILKYIYYFLTTVDVSSIVKGMPPKINQENMRNINIPIPSRETQERIVKILDTFAALTTELIAELTTELTLRQKQYAYYRNMLLSEEYLKKLSEKIEGLRNNTEISFYALSKVFNTRNGYTPSKSVQEFWESEDIPWFKMEDIRENGNILSYAKNYVSNSAIKGEPFEQNSIILSTSATIGEHALITVPFLANQRFTCFSLKDNYKKEINIKYVYYYFYIIDKWCNNNIKIGNFPSVDVRTLLTQKIPIPSIYIQNKVVEILDAFQAMAHQVSGLLPKEREQRQKQYEYYREKLLDFPK